MLIKVTHNHPFDALVGNICEYYVVISASVMYKNICTTFSAKTMTWGFIDASILGQWMQQTPLIMWSGDTSDVQPAESSIRLIAFAAGRCSGTLPAPKHQSPGRSCTADVEQRPWSGPRPPPRSPLSSGKWPLPPRWKRLIVRLIVAVGPARNRSHCFHISLFCCHGRRGMETWGSGLIFSIGAGSSNETFLFSIQAL